MDSQPTKIHRGGDKHVQELADIKMDKGLPLGTHHPRNSIHQHLTLLRNQQK